MSQTRSEVISCPDCGHRQAFTVWDSVSSDDRRGVAALTSGSAYIFCCGKCGYTTTVAYPLLYSDMDHRRFIWLIPPDMKARTKEILSSTALPGIRQMAVYSPAELAEAMRAVDLSAEFI